MSGVPERANHQGLCGIRWAAGGVHMVVASAIDALKFTGAVLIRMFFGRTYFGAENRRHHYMRRRRSPESANIGRSATVQERRMH